MKNGVFFLLSFSSLANPLCEHGPQHFHCVEYLENYDGDTITFNIPHIHPLFGKKAKIRLSGIDTPEIKNPCEKKEALKAKEFVALLLGRAKRIDLKNIQRGKYFRIVADVIVDGQSLSTILLEQKLGHPYHGKTKRKKRQCPKRRPSKTE